MANSHLRTSRVKIARCVRGMLSVGLTLVSKLIHSLGPPSEPSKTGRLEYLSGQSPLRIDPQPPSNILSLHASVILAIRLLQAKVLVRSYRRRRQEPLRRLVPSHHRQLFLSRSGLHQIFAIVPVQINSAMADSAWTPLS